MKTFEEVWELIVKQENMTCKTIRGQEFTYKRVPPEGQTLVISLVRDKKGWTTAHSPTTSKGVLERAFRMGNLRPGEYANNGISGPSYVWGIFKKVRCFD